MEIFFFWLVFSIIVAVAANSRGRSGVGWFILSIFISPLLGLILVLVLPSNNAPQKNLSAEQPTPETHVRCPDCRELVRMDAKKCKHCGTALVPIEIPAAPKAPPIGPNGVASENILWILTAILVAGGLIYLIFR